jgi:hypothetical protein
MREERYETALICFNSAIEATEVERLKAEALGTPVGGINALATQAQAQRGHALALMGEVSEAMESYNTALSLDSSTVEAWIGKGRLLTGMGRYEEALFCFDSALELDESMGEAWAGKGQVLMQMGRQVEAQTYLSRAAALAGHSITAPIPDLAIPPTPSPVEAYDPDVPFELQQIVMGLPSADTDLTHVSILDDDLPAELAAEVAQLPSQPDNAVAYGQSEQLAYSPGIVEYAQPGAVEYSPGVSEYDLGTVEYAQPGAVEYETGIGEYGSGAVVEYRQPGVTEYDPEAVEYDLGTVEYIQPGTVEYSPEVADYGPGMAEYSSAAVEYIQPGAVEYDSGTVEYGQPVTDEFFAPLDFSVTEFSQPLEDELIQQIDLSGSGDESADLDIQITNPPVSNIASVDGSLVEVPLEPGDFVPPPPDSSSQLASDSETISNLPPEILAALASIPPGSSDSFDLPSVTETAAPVPAPTAPVPLSWVRLSIDPESRSRFYAVWHVDRSDRAPLSTGETLAVRLYDVTGLSTQAPLPAPVEEQRCHDDFAQDWYLPIPQWERIYIAEIGYISALGQWRAIARSTEIAAIEEQKTKPEEQG